MSRKPYIKIVYPDASQIAMLLTEAMVRRASGKRVVETESSERESAGQDLFASSLCCVTETSVELTLNLAPEAMDFALATLIAKNLTQPERDQAMEASDSLELDALFSFAQAAEAPRQALDGDSSADVPSAEREAVTQSGEQEKQIEVGKIKDCELRDIMRDLIDCSQGYVSGGPDAYDEHINNIIDHAVKKINCAASVIDPEKDQENTSSEKPKKAKRAKKKKQEPTWDDVADEARKIGMRVTIEPADNTDGEIDAGLLNDTETEGVDHG